MTRSELHDELRKAINRQNILLVLSLIESLLKVTTSTADREDLLTQKHDFLALAGADKSLLDSIVAQVFKVNPRNLEFKLRHIKNLFEGENLWRALTEFKRFEAETLWHLS